MSRSEMHNGPMGRRGWDVLESVHTADGMYCVDFFVDGSGAFGFGQFRADPEDQGGWTLLSRSHRPFESIQAAQEEALTAIPWLRKAWSATGP